MDEQQQGGGVPGPRPLRSEPYRGRYRVNPDRSVDVWNGQRYVPRTAATLAPEAQELITRERNELDRDNLSVRLGNQFLNYNQETPTGSVVRRIPLLNELGLALNPGLQQMENIQNRFVRSQIREGTSGAGNTGPEQLRIERSGPSITNSGPANRAIVLGLQIDRDLRAQRLSELERWVRDPRNRGPEGFEQWWSQNEARLRADIQRRYEETNGPLNNQAGLTGSQRANPPRRPAGVPQDAQWDPDRRRWVAP